MKDILRINQFWDISMSMTHGGAAHHKALRPKDGLMAPLSLQFVFFIFILLFLLLVIIGSFALVRLPRSVWSPPLLFLQFLALLQDQLVLDVSSLPLGRLHTTQRDTQVRT